MSAVAAGLYLLGFLIIGTLVFAIAISAVQSAIPGAPTFVKMFVLFLALGFFGILWFAFGDSVVREVLGWFFDFDSPAASQNAPPPGPSTSFSDHPVIWFVHLFAYAFFPGVFFWIFLFTGLTLNDRWWKRFSTAAFFAYFAFLIYWHLEGMALLVSWFG